MHAAREPLPVSVVVLDAFGRFDRGDDPWQSGKGGFEE